MQLQLFHSVDKDKPFRVERIPYKDAKEFLLPRHYSGRMPIVSYAYGWIQGNTIRACLTIGKPASHFVCCSPFGEEYSSMIYELSRLCTDGGDLPPLSKFLGECLRMLKDINIILVSYADTGMNHNGYIYQATNWIYTGEGGQKDNYIDDKGNDFHSLTINDRLKEEKLDLKDYLLKYNIKKVKADPKYRYLYFLGNKREVKNMKKELKLDILNYPKGKNERYDSSYICAEQTKLF